MSTNLGTAPIAMLSHVTAERWYPYVGASVIEKRRVPGPEEPHCLTSVGKESM
jgi:hypothetical protein